MRNIIDRVRKSILIKNSILFSFFSFLNKGLNFILLIVIAGFISPDGYGRISLFTTTVTLFSFLINVNTTGIISVDYFKLTGKQLNKTINSVLVITLGCFLLLSGAILLFSDYIKEATDFNFGYQWVALWICLLTVITQINLEIWRLEEKAVIYGIYTTGLVLTNFVLTLIFIVVLKEDWQGRIYAYIITYLFFAIISIIILIRKGYMLKSRPSLNSIKECLKFGLPLIPHTSSFWLRQGLDRYLLNLYQSTTMVGYFSFAYNFANIVHMLGDAFNASNSVYIYKCLSNDPIEFAVKKLKKLSSIMIGVFLLISLMVCLGSYMLIPLIFPAYAESIDLLCILCVGAFFQCIYLLFVNYLFYYKKTTKLMYITFTISVCHALLSIVLTKYSIYYTVCISTLSNIAIAIGVYLYSRKLIKLY